MRTTLGIACGLIMLAAAAVGSRQLPEPAKDGRPKPLFAIGAITPRIAPDGRLIAFSYQGAIWPVTGRGGIMFRVTDGDGFDMEPAWSPDSRRIAFVRGPNQPGGDLRIVEATDDRIVDFKEVPLPKPVQVRGTYNFQKLE